MRVLNAGSGLEPFPALFAGEEIVTLDADASLEPDIVADVRDLGAIGPYDVVYCSHVLEHLERSDALVALREFYRVLRPGGVVVIYTPDGDGVTPDDRVLYISPLGPITGRDIVYGLQKAVNSGNEWMRHKFLYDAESLRADLETAGFSDVSVKRLPFYNLFGAGRRD